LGVASFELYRRSISGSAVAPLWVVEHLDVVEDIGLGGIACRVDLAADALALEQLKEALGHGVVAAVATTAHAGDQFAATTQLWRFYFRYVRWTEQQMLDRPTTA
jgi:hypothetical protein